jgi:hypothetical protein
MKYFELAPFDLHLNAETIIAALRNRSVEGDNVETRESEPDGAGR